MSKGKVAVLVFLACVALSSSFPSEKGTDGQGAGSGQKTNPAKTSVLPSAKIEEEIICELPPRAEDLEVSPNGLRFAWREKREKTWAMIVDGQAGPEYDTVEEGVFSPDSQHHAYIARRDVNWQALLDGKEAGPAYPGGKRWASVTNLTFSADSQHLAYFRRDAKNFRLVIDGQEQGPECTPLSPLELSPDGKRWAYLDQRGVLKGYYVSDAGETGHRAPVTAQGAYNYTYNQPVLSPDGKRLGYVASREQKRFMVIDGKEMQPFDSLENPVFSPDSQRFAYAYYDQCAWIMIDGNPAPEVEGPKVTSSLETEGTIVSPLFKPAKFAIHDGQLATGFGRIAAGPVFSPDSMHIAYVALWFKKYVQVIDNLAIAPKSELVEDIEVTSCYGLTFSPDGKRLAYVFRRQGVPNEKDISVIFLDGMQLGPEFEKVGYPAFSPSSRFLTILVQRGKKRSMVINGKEGKGYDSLWARSLAFSADEKQVTYTAQEGNKLLRITQFVE